MNAPATPRRHSAWPWIVGLILAPFVILGSAVVSAFRLDADAAALRRQIAAAGGGHWGTQVQFSVPAGAVGLARAATACIHDLPSEARDGLAALESASVGVYAWTGADAAGPGRHTIADADRGMARRGWTRIVGVVDDRNTVLIYAPADAGTARPDRLCLAVCDGRQLVVVAARFDGRALARLIGREIETHARLARL